MLICLRFILRVIPRHDYEHMFLLRGSFLAIHEYMYSHIYLHEIVHVYLFSLSFINSTVIGLITGISSLIMLLPPTVSLSKAIDHDADLVQAESPKEERPTSPEV